MIKRIALSKGMDPETFKLIKYFGIAFTILMILILGAEYAKANELFQNLS